MKMQSKYGAIAGICLGMMSLTACGESTSTPADNVPETAQSREDIEKIVRAYILENPEIIMEAMDVLAERRTLDIAAELEADERAFSYGPEDAAVTIVEYFDYRCTYCKRSLDWVMEQAEPDSGDVRIIFKEFPILSEQSRRAALAAVAAAEQGKYMEFHQALMRSPEALTDEKIDEIAESVGLNLTKLHKVMEDPKTMEYLQSVREEAIQYGAEATPSFFINGELIQGYDRAKLEERMDALLN